MPNSSSPPRSSTQALPRQMLLACLVAAALCAMTEVVAPTCPVEPGYEPFEEYCDGPDCETAYRAFCGTPGGIAGENFESTSTTTLAPTVTTVNECSSIATSCALPGVSSSCKLSLLEHQCKQLHTVCSGDRACIMEELNRITELFGGGCPSSSTSTVRGSTTTTPRSSSSSSSSSTTPSPSSGPCGAAVHGCTIPGLASSCSDNMLMYHCQKVNSSTCHGDEACLQREVDAFVELLGGSCGGTSSSIDCDSVISGCSIGGGLSSSCETGMLKYSCRKHQATCGTNTSCVKNGVAAFASKLGGSCSSSPGSGSSSANCTALTTGCTLDGSMSDACAQSMIMYECKKISASSCAGDSACTKGKVSQFCTTFGGSCSNAGPSTVNCAAMAARYPPNAIPGLSTTCQDALVKFKCEEFATACDHDQACVIIALDEFVATFA